MSARVHFVQDRVVVYYNNRKQGWREGIIIEELGAVAVTSDPRPPVKKCFKYRVWFRWLGQRTIVDGNDGFSIIGLIDRRV